MNYHKSIYFQLAIIVLVLVSSFHIKADHIPTHPPPTRCYAVADGGDALLWIERLTPPPYPHTGNFVGNLGVQNVETMTFNLAGTIIYTVNDVNAATDQFGSINPFTGIFSPIGAPITTANNVYLGTRVMDDVDSLAIHPLTGDMWAITHNPKYIFRIDSATGQIIPDTFGPGNDYYEVSLANIPGGPTDIDDLGIDPLDGTFYIIANSNTPDRLVYINIDGFNPAASPGLNSPANGQISTTDVAALTNITDGSNVTDMEGFSFYNDGTFYGTTGSQSTPAVNDNSIWIIDPTTGVTSLLGTMDDPSDAINNTDYEGLGCLTGGSNIIQGQVFCEPAASYDGIFNAGDTLQAGATVNLYVDNNNSGNVEGSDTLIQTAITDGSGSFNFEVGIAGNFVIEMDSAIIPIGAIKTTDPPLPANPVDEADFINTGTYGSEYNNIDSDNEYGFTCTALATSSADIAIMKIDDIDPVVIGNNVQYRLTITNNGPDTATGILVTDTLPPNVTYVSDTGACIVSGGPPGGTLNCSIISLASGASQDIVVTVTGTSLGTDINSATVTANEPDSDPTNNSASEDTTVIDVLAGTDLVINKTDSTDPVFVGDDFTYTITVINNGPQAATGVTVTDTLPSNVRYVSDTGACTLAVAILSCPIGNLTVGTSASFNVTVTALTVDTVMNSAIVTGNEPDTNPNNNQDIEPTGIVNLDTGIEEPNLLVYFDPGLSKIGFLHESELGLQGEQIEWVFTVVNNGNATGINIVISDTLRPELHIDKVIVNAGMQYSTNGQTVTVTIPSLAPRQSVHFSIFSTVLQSDRTVDNMACLDADNLDEPRCVRAPVIAQLPITGESPWWKTPYLFAGIILGLLGVIYLRIHELRQN